MIIFEFKIEVYEYDLEEDSSQVDRYCMIVLYLIFWYIGSLFTNYKLHWGKAWAAPLWCERSEKSLKDQGSNLMSRFRRTESVIQDLVKEVVTLRFAC